ncbi:MAG: Methyltransferase domain [Ilumatobacteraceae bacterium]|nr:Methyltransferase domain [Ilumatobacteraceae bacterium]
MGLGRVLDIGCGVGRNLAHLDGNGVGIDHNIASVQVARASGLVAYVTDQFESSADAVHGSFDSLLFAHVLEHMTAPEATALVQHYLPYLKNNGRVVVICPQQRGQRSDSTHVTFMRPDVIANVLSAAGVTVQRDASFPFPPVVGRWFTHNETIVIGRPTSR